MGFLIATKRTPSRGDVRGDTRGPRPSSLGMFETSHADEMPDRDFCRVLASSRWLQTGGTLIDSEMGRRPIFKSIRVPPKRQNPVQIRSGKDNGAVTQFFLKRQMESLGALGVPGRRTRTSWRKFHDGPLVAPRHRRRDMTPAAGVRALFGARRRRRCPCVLRVRCGRVAAASDAPPRAQDAHAYPLPLARAAGLLRPRTRARSGGW